MIAMLTVIVFAIITAACFAFSAPEEDIKFTDIKTKHNEHQS